LAGNGKESGLLEEDSEDRANDAEGKDTASEDAVATSCGLSFYWDYTHDCFKSVTNLNIC